MSIFYDNPNYREFFLTWHCAGERKKQQHMCQFLSCSLQSLDQSSVVRKNVMGVAYNCEIVGRSTGQGGETACPSYYWMADMELHEGKKWRHKRRRNRHDRGNPPISKVKILAETAAWRNNWKVAGITEGGSTPDKCRIGGGSSGVIVSVTGRKPFCARCKHCNDNKQRYFRRFSNWAEKFTAQRWLDFVVFKNFGSR